MCLPISKLALASSKLALALASILCLGACQTGRPKNEAVILVDPNVPSAPAGADGDEGPTAAAKPAAPPRPAAAFAEPLRPLRGGLRVLPPFRGAEPCRMALLGESPVAKACSERGLRGATELMQTFVRRARAEGLIFECADCHANEDDYSKLTPQADVEFCKLLFLARPE